ncbi:collagen alpha-1(XX) chain [Aplysia californica]|uniref:Collagen alpha-1(XX) chain n=1 Tax=Aplysia californica TaxID=6500 RepID=A0ABM0JCH9_APLCA|nr:collagen alpha-1(XX) chain [Aplysia californica]
MRASTILDLVGLVLLTFAGTTGLPTDIASGPTFPASISSSYNPDWSLPAAHPAPTQPLEPTATDPQEPSIFDPFNDFDWPLFPNSAANDQGRTLSPDISPSPSSSSPEPSSAEQSTTQRTTTTPTPEPTEAVPDITGSCKKQMDLLFILDSSASMSEKDFKKELDFAARIAGNLDIGESGTRVSLMQFSTSARSQFCFGDYYNKDDLIKAIKETPFKRGLTFTHMALESTRVDTFTDACGSRPDVPHVAILVTDGKSTFPSSTRAQASQLKSSGVKVISVGVGDEVVQAELESIASSSQLVFTVTRMQALSGIKQQIFDDVCTLGEESIPASAPPPGAPSSTIAPSAPPPPSISDSSSTPPLSSLPPSSPPPPPAAPSSPPPSTQPPSSPPPPPPPPAAPPPAAEATAAKPSPPLDDGPANNSSQKLESEQIIFVERL